MEKLFRSTQILLHHCQIRCSDLLLIPFLIHSKDVLNFFLANFHISSQPSQKSVFQKNLGLCHLCCCLGLGFGHLCSHFSGSSFYCKVCGHLTPGIHGWSSTQWTTWRRTKCQNTVILRVVCVCVTLCMSWVKGILR